MKALICNSYGPPETLEVGELDAPKAKKGQVVLEVAAAAVNFPDVLIIQNKYQAQHTPPFAPGSEVSGTIIELGEGVEKWKIGDKVIAACGIGGMAEKVVADASRCQPIPNGMNLSQAAAFLMTYGTSYHALKDRAELKAGETLLVMGAAGGVGLAAVELGKAMGARVIAATSSEEKNQTCLDAGADEAFCYPKGALSREQQKEFSEKIKNLTNGAGADVVYDPIGSDYAEPALRSTAWRGRYLVIGFAAGDIPKIPLNLALLKGCQIVGVFWGAFTMHQPADSQRNLEKLAEMFEQGKIKPFVSKTYKLSEGKEALIDMASRKVRGKIVVLPKE